MNEDLVSEDLDKDEEWESDNEGQGRVLGIRGRG